MQFNKYTHTHTHTHTHSSSTTYSYTLILVRIDTYIMVFLGTTETTTATVYVLCVFFPFILDIKFVGRTSRGHTGGRSHRISHPPSFCGACASFSREKDSAVPFPRRAFFVLFYCYFLVRKNPVYRDSNSRPNVSEGYEVTSELPG